jgi:hypothetical protein
LLLLAVACGLRKSAFQDRADSLLKFVPERTPFSMKYTPKTLPVFRAFFTIYPGYLG